MHTLLHLAPKLLLIGVTAVLFTLFILHRPGATQTSSKKSILALLVVGAAIGVVFLATQSIYVQPPSA
ncbi:MAG: hypothetical protein A2201_13940 [Alicyclobacillus sp. RIFOXYA1_FULL_53_8]|nr:MAG: hypothetical protein A2201_13940 [Alicyclobacillus sp. RIFOXYA1_FULL_53_8]